MRNIAIVLLAIVVALVVYLLLWPVPIHPVAWQAPAPPEYAGAHARNTRLANIKLVAVAPEIGPEHIAVGPDGMLYTGALSGAILRMNADGTDARTIANTGGRPLGLAFDGSARLIIADALRGLLALEPDGRVVVLADKVGSDPIRYADAVVVAGDGKLLFTDASRRFSPREFGTFDAALLDIMEHSCTGRVVEFDPARSGMRTIISGLCFPNGVALTRDEQHLIVAETGAYRIWKIRRSATGVEARAHAQQRADAGRQPGETEPPEAFVLIDNLPGFPDNVTRGESGRFWTGLTKPRSPIIDRMAGHPWLRAMTLRLPQAAWPVPPAYGHVIAFDAQGRVLADLQDPAGALPETSGATEHNGQLYVQSLHGAAFGIIPVP
jgi:sugar lactone lactonase YvrE